MTTWFTKLTGRSSAPLSTASIAVQQRRVPAGSGAAPKLYSEFFELPPYETLLTAANGQYALSESFRSKLAVVVTGKTSALILADKDSFNRQDYASLLSRVKKDYRVVSVGLAKPSLLLLLYSKSAPIASRRDRDRDVSETALSVSLFKDIMNKGAQAKASDVHFLIREGQSTDFAKIYFRIDGVMRLFDKIPSSNALEAVGVAFTKLAEDTSRSDPTFNSRTMQSCSIPIALNGRDYKLRYQSVPVNGGIDVIMRLLQTASDDNSADSKARSLQELGYSQTQCRQLDFAARKTVGATIIAGVTGSGKSTTLQTLMTASPTRHQRKSYSIEDPVEYKMTGVSQISVQRQAVGSDSSGFTAAMRVVLRADPDVVMIGEVRDGETCSLLKTMVQSGHQVMTSVHAASVVDIVQRMTSKELGLPRETLGSRNFLSALVYQRLVPLLCAHCRISMSTARTDRYHLDTVRHLISKFGLNAGNMFVTNADGCEHCAFLGSRGVTVVAEIIIPDNTLLRLLREGLDVEAEEYWRGTRTTAFDDPDSVGKTAFEHGLYKAHCGEVDPYHIENAFEPFDSYIVYPIPVIPVASVTQMKFIAGVR